jgi:brefeldin A-resistance guanine nucleotide exchange factor 1
MPGSVVTDGQHSTQTEWNVIFATLRSTISNSEAARSTFNLVASFASEGLGQEITPDNFAGLLSTLDDFATAAGAPIRLTASRPRRTPQQPTAELVNSPLQLTLTHTPF